MSRHLFATTTCATYYPEQYFIELHCSRAAELSAFLDGSGTHTPSTIGYLAHESQHWFDHLYSRWGQDQRDDLYRAIVAWISKDVYRFSDIATWQHKREHDSLLTYYLIKGTDCPRSVGDQRLLSIHTCGQRFNADGKVNTNSALVLSRFVWADGTLAFRAPFSVYALLEARALEAEFSAMLQEVASGRIARDDLENDFRARIRSSELGIYSVAIHSVANHCGLWDLEHALRRTALLAGVALNVTPKQIEQIRFPPDSDAWGCRRSVMRRHRDRGFAFLSILLNSDPMPHSNDDSWLQNALRTAGLIKEPLWVGPPASPNAQALIGTAQNIHSAICAIVDAGPPASVDMRHGRVDIGRALQDGVLPPLMFWGGEYCNDIRIPCALDHSQWESWFLEWADLEGRMMDFVRVCGV